METKASLGYTLDTDLFKSLREDRRTAAEVETPGVDAHAMETLTTESARLDSNTARLFPESPSYLVILIMVLLGVIVNFLFFIR